MRFSAVHKVSSYLMIGAAFGALALSRELSPVILLVTAVAMALSFFAEPARWAFMRRRGWTTAWNLATLVAFAFSVLEAVGGDVLHAGVRFLCLLIVNKLWNRRASRDYLQAYAVSFLMLVAGAAISSDLSYAVCFLAYVVFATWTLTLFHLRREMEENSLVKHSDGAQSERVEVERILSSRRIVGGRFLLGTSLVSLAVFFSSTVAFFLIPRVGFGFFVSRTRKGVNTVGFADRVELGQYGLVKDNPQIIMRVELPVMPQGGLRLRGVTFDRYQNGRWSRTTDVHPMALRRFGEITLVGDIAEGKLDTRAVKARLARAHTEEIYLEPLDTAVVFATPVPVGFGINQTPTTAHTIELETRGPTEVMAMERRTEVGAGRTISVDRRTALRYVAYYEDPPSVISLLTRDAPPGEPPREVAPYARPVEGIAQRVVDLSLEVTRGHPGAVGKALAIERHLREHYRYTLDLKRDARYEPLEDFLFVQKAGHCEYFASAMVIMARASGLPARVVNGFLGGEWNSYGKYVAVRQGDAHSWVEVWIAGAGWVTFDPTPVGTGAAKASSWTDSMRQMLDTVELAWMKWVIEYDLGKQADAVSAVRKWAGTSTLKQWWQRLRWGLGGTLLLVGAVALWRRRRRFRLSLSLQPAQARALTAFARAERALARRGFSRSPSETPAQLAARVRLAADAAAAPFDALVGLYYAARFGAVSVDAATLDALAAQVIAAPVVPKWQAPPPANDIASRDGSAETR